jgi:hypothetical protein
MGAKYDSGLYDSNDIIAAYNEGYDDALRKLILEIRIRCPWCETQLAFIKQPLLSLPIDLLATTRLCQQCETLVQPQIRISAAS